MGLELKHLFIIILVIIVGTKCLNVGEINIDEQNQAINEVTYPTFGNYGPNILFKDTINFNNLDYSMAAELSLEAALNITITRFSGTGLWYYILGSEQNWAISLYDNLNNTQIFTSVNDNQICDLHMQFDPGSYLIDYYENNSSTITFFKIIIIN